MRLHTKETAETHLTLLENYKNRLGQLEDFKENQEEKETPFERSFLHNAILLHELWFEQLEDTKEDTKAPLLEEILARRESDLSTFQDWLGEFAHAASPHGWVVWGWSHTLKTFVAFPIKSHDENVPLGITPLLVIDCWEHSYITDYGIQFHEYLTQFWHDLNWDVIDRRHKELATMYGYDLK